MMVLVGGVHTTVEQVHGVCPSYLVALTLIGLWGREG